MRIQRLSDCEKLDLSDAKKEKKSKNPINQWILSVLKEIYIFFKKWLHSSTYASLNSETMWKYICTYTYLEMFWFELIFHVFGIHILHLDWFEIQIFYWMDRWIRTGVAVISYLFIFFDPATKARSEGKQILWYLLYETTCLSYYYLKKKLTLSTW